MGLAESTDTVGRWMAHHIAELMETARAARGKPSEAAASSGQRGRGRGGFITGPVELHHQVLATFVDLLASSFDTTTERDWLEKYGDFLSEEERALLKRVTEVPSLRHLVSTANEDPASRLKDLAQQYQAAVVAMVTAIESIFQTDDHSTG
jgi:hypothetical protein